MDNTLKVSPSRDHSNRVSLGQGHLSHARLGCLELSRASIGVSASTATTTEANMGATDEESEAAMWAEACSYQVEAAC